MTTVQLKDLKSASIPQLKELIDTMQSEANYLPTERKSDALKLIGKVIDIYTMKRFGKKF